MNKHLMVEVALINLLSCVVEVFGIILKQVPFTRK